MQWVPPQVKQGIPVTKRKIQGGIRGRKLLKILTSNIAKITMMPQAMWTGDLGG